MEPSTSLHDSQQWRKASHVAITASCSYFQLHSTTPPSTNSYHLGSFRVDSKASSLDHISVSETVPATRLCSQTRHKAVSPFSKSHPYSSSVFRPRYPTATVTRNHAPTRRPDKVCCLTDTESHSLPARQHYHYRATASAPSQRARQQRV
jgi:hypothetical protein